MTTDEFIDELRKFYEKLEKSQKYLGEEFEEILYDNLWDMCEN